MITSESILTTLGGAEDAAALVEGWAASQACLPNGPLFFLEQPFVAAAGTEAALDTAFIAALVTAARHIESTHAARALAWHVYYRLRHDALTEDWPGRHWPLPEALLGQHAGLLYALALLGGLPDLRALYMTHGVPEGVARATLRDVQRHARVFRSRRGVWGLTPRDLSWLRLHLSGGIFELGRLQFQPSIWQRPAQAYRHTAGGAVVALSEEGVRYRADGQRDGAGGLRDSHGAWTARLEPGSEWVVGHRIRPNGQAEREETRLSRAEWELVLGRGDPVLDLHIPAGAPLDLEACRASLHEALRFFPTHFPERPIVAFACGSWLLDAQLEDLLPPSSNLVRFLRQMYLVPVAGDGSGALEYVFGDVDVDLRQAPRDTALRRALLDHLLGGGHLRGGSCFLLPEDLPRWGADTYRQDRE